MGLASETFTFLFTDIVGSTALMQTMEPSMVAAVADHDALLLPIFESYGGHVFKHTGDGYCVAFAAPQDALHTAIAAQRALHGHSWDLPQPLRVRMAIQTGPAVARDGDYRGLTLSRANRLVSLGHGGQILLSESAAIAVRPYLPHEISLSDLGSARLPGLERAERVYQVVAPGMDQGFPPPRSLETFPHNLKEQTTSFIGREQELSEVLELCRERRLITVMGPGGCGKTRLALHAAAHLVDDFPDGVWMIELAGLTDPALIPAAVAAELKVRQEGVQTQAEALSSFFQSRRLLLILDNCEHVVDAAARFAYALLQSAPGVRILATSRERLNVSGETIWRIPPLTPPAGQGAASLESVLNSDAATLFVERATAMQPRFVLSAGNAQSVTQVCRRLEGLPLALELAAAWVGTLQVEQIAARLEKHFRLLSSGPRLVAERHRSLQAALDWSYDLLTEQERMLLCRLSVFAGGWTLEAAEAVCAGQGIDHDDVLEFLGCLVDKSLVAAEEQNGAMRYRLLETLRVYSSDKLCASSNDLPARHAAYFLEWAEAAAPYLTGSEQGTWLSKIERDHDNLRAALRCLSDTDAEAFQRLASALYQFWYSRGYLTEGRNWLEEAVAKADETITEIRAKAVNRAGVFAWTQGDLNVAWMRMQASLSISRKLGDESRIAIALGNLALVAGDRSDFQAAARCQLECLEISRRINDQEGIAIALHNLGALAERQGNDTAAIAYYQEAFALSQAISDEWGSAEASRCLGAAAYRLGDLETASTSLKIGLEHLHRSDDRDTAFLNWCYVAYLAAAKHQNVIAVKLLRQYSFLSSSQCWSDSEADLEIRSKHLQILRSRFSEEEFARLWNDETQITVQQVLSIEELWH